MSQEQYDKIISSEKVQMSGDNKVHVANQVNINTFGKQAPKGSLYIKCDVLGNTISKGGKVMAVCNGSAITVCRICIH